MTSPTRERSPLRVWVSRMTYGEGYVWECPNCDAGREWLTRGDAIRRAERHTCPALRLARLEAELEGLVEQYRLLADTLYKGFGEAEGFEHAWSDLADILARHRQASA